MAIPTATTLNYDPDLPVYAEPETQQTATNIAPLNPSSSYVDENKATVAGQMKGLLAENNDYMKMNVAQAAKDANKRGMLNSSMAVQAGRAAAINAVLPIAQQDAQMYGNMAQQSQKTTEDSLLNNQLAGIEYKKSLNNARISAALTSVDQKGQIEVQKLADTAQMQRLEVDNQWKDMLNMDQMDTEEAKGLMQVSAALGSELTGSIERVLRDTNIENKTEAVNALMTQYRAQLTTAAAIVNIPLTWS